MLTRNSIILVGQGREEVHPLVNSAVLRNIFGYLDMESVKSARATCTFWKEAANSILQNKSKVTITWYNAMDRQNCPCPTLPTFMKYVESVTPENVFFRNYELADWCLHSKEVEMTQFWLQCGQHIQNLALKDYYFGFYEESYVRNVFFNWTPNMESLDIKVVRFVNNPNYKPLVLDKIRWVSYEDEDGEYCEEEETVSDTDNDDGSNWVPMQKFEILKDIQPNYKFRSFRMDFSYDYPVFPLQWKELFIAYPNLELLRTLSVSPCSENEDADNIKELLTDLVEFQLANPNKLQNLKTLDIFSHDDEGDSAVTDEHYKEAMKLNFKLESLDIFFDETEKLSYLTIAKYISKLSTTLKNLEIRSGRDVLTVFPPHGNRIVFPRLISLIIELNALSSNNVEFLQNIPKLEKLFIGDCDLPTCDITEPRLFLNTITMEPKNNLRTLDIGADLLTEDCIRKIGEWFPNLTEFGAILDDNLLWAAYKFLCKSVEILRIYGKGITDAGITGIEIDTTNKSKEPMPSSSKSAIQEIPKKRRKHNDVLEDQTILRTSIAQMKKLRHLTITRMHIPNSKPVQLTDDAVYNGFILLTELTYLNLSFRLETITEEAFRDLCSRRNIMTLDTTHFYRGSGVKKAGMRYGQTFTKIEI